MSWAAPDVYVVGQVLTSTSMNKVGGDLSAASAVGSYQFVCAIAGAAATETLWQGAWLECNGAAVSRTTYAALFNYLNGLSTPLAFGTGNGSTTFNVPDVSGREMIAMAPSTGNVTVKTLGNNDGIAVANRRGTKHQHTPHAHGGIPAPSSTDNGGAAPGNVSGTQNSSSADGGSGVATDPLDGGAYLVAGVWVIKALL